MNMWCLAAFPPETDEDCNSRSYLWKKSHLTITLLMKKKGKSATVCSLQVCSAFSASVSCRQWSPGTEKAVAFGPACVLWVCVQPHNPTTGCRDNILWGQPRVLPTGWHFWQPLIEPRVLNYSYRCYGVAIFTGDTNPQMNCGCLSLQVNTVVMIWGCDAF